MGRSGGLSLSRRREAQGSRGRRTRSLRTYSRVGSRHRSRFLKWSDAYLALVPKMLAPLVSPKLAGSLRTGGASATHSALAVQPRRFGCCRDRPAHHGMLLASGLLHSGGTEQGDKPV